MSKPSPEVYEDGRGMDAHNSVMREIRGLKEKHYDPHEPTRVWVDEDNTPDGVYESLTIILNTGGCRWARAGGCTMCGYVAESVEGGTVEHEALMDQIQACLDHEAKNTDEPADLIKIYTSGSFLDEREVPAETRQAIAETFGDRERIVLESLPDFVDHDKITDFTDHGLDVDVAVGLETATDRIRKDCVNKYFEFADFEDACATAKEAGAGVKAYLLMKPPLPLGAGSTGRHGRLDPPLCRCRGLSHGVDRTPVTSSSTRWSTNCFAKVGTDRRGSGRLRMSWSGPLTSMPSSSPIRSATARIAEPTTAESATTESRRRSRTSISDRTRLSSSRSTVTASERGSSSSRRRRVTRCR